MTGWVVAARRQVANRPPCTRWFAVALAGFTLLLAGCQDSPELPPQRYTVVEFADLPGWDETEDGADNGALQAIYRSCASFSRQPRSRVLGADGIAGTIGDWRAVCDDALEVSHANLRTWFETRFLPIAVAAGDGADGLFTGYFEPDLRGSRRRQGPYQHPLYKRPPDLVTEGRGDGRKVGRRVGGQLVPYHARAEIDGGALAGRGLEILWLDDPLDSFFLHIQGSGRVRLDTGETIRIGYAAGNGRRYLAIGRELLSRGVIPRGEATMQGIRRWLEANPQTQDEILHLNESYVFFRELDGPGPVGAQGVALTAEHSLAVDPRYVPLGIPVWLDTTHPLRPSEPFRRLMVAQDTGGAIKGVVRGDVFWGSGDTAGLAAGAMKQKGRYWLLVPKAVVERIGLS